MGADLGGRQRSLRCSWPIRNGLGVADVKELIAKAKAEPGKLTDASPGAGTVGHLAAKQFEMLAGVQFNVIPYRGLAPALTDIVGGHVDMIFDTTTTSLPMHKGNQVKIIATGARNARPSCRTFRPSPSRDCPVSAP